MPYIDKPGREQMEPLLAPLLDDIDNWTVGALNYAITRLALAWLRQDPSYTVLNAGIGALECAKQELYRRMVVPYEEGKQAANGDVYPESDQARRDNASKRG
jgi:hypothetical protein